MIFILTNIYHPLRVWTELILQFHKKEISNAQKLNIAVNIHRNYNFVETLNLIGQSISTEFSIRDFSQDEIYEVKHIVDNVSS